MLVLSHTQPLRAKLTPSVLDFQAYTPIPKSHTLTPQP
jgi:hypothetical protein